MARLEYFDGVENIAHDLKHFHAKNLEFLGGSTSASGFTLADGSGAQVVVTGTGLHYDGDSYPAGGFSSGTITQVEVRDAGGHVLFELSQLTVAAVDFIPANFDASVESPKSFFAGNDVVIGSALSDALAGGRGNDVLHGNAGKDLLQGGSGNDTMYGGADADQFLFRVKDKGTDHIKDFTDGGGAADDHMVVTHAMYDAMVVTAVAGGVELTFGHEHVMVDGWTVGQVGLDDFTFNG